MKRFKTTLVSLCMPLVAGALVVGCGEAGDGAASASADKSATAAKSAAPATSAKPAAATTQSAQPAAAKDATPAPAPAAASAETLKFMPKTCEKARVFVNTGKLLAGDVGKALDTLKGTFLSSMAGKADAEKLKKAEADVEAAGLTTSSIKELAICAGKAKSGVAAARLDFKGNLGDTLAKVIETASGKAPEKKEEDGWTLITGDKDTFIAVKDGIVIQGASMADVKAAAKGGDGASDFGDAASYVIWVKAEDHGKPLAITLKEAGSDFEGKIVMPPPANLEADFKKDKAEGLKKIQSEIDKAVTDIESTPFKVCAPAIKNAKVSMDGDNVVIASTFPQSLLGEAANIVAKDPNGIFKMMR